MSELPSALPQKPWLNITSLVTLFDIFWFSKLLKLSFLSILDWNSHLIVKKHKRDSPGGLVINTLSSQCKVKGLIPGQGTRYPHASPESSHATFHLNSCIVAKPILSYTSTIIQLSLFIGHLWISRWFWNYILWIKSSSKNLHVTTKTQCSQVKYLKNGKKKKTRAQSLRATRYKLWKRQ